MPIVNILIAAFGCGGVYARGRVGKVYVFWWDSAADTKEYYKALKYIQSNAKKSRLFKLNSTLKKVITVNDSSINTYQYVIIKNVIWLIIKPMNVGQNEPYRNAGKKLWLSTLHFP